MRLLRRPPSEELERGSMIVVLAVILVVSVIGSAIAFHSIGSAFVSTGQQSNASALSLADAGLADALYRIDQGSTGTGGGTAFCVRAGDAKCVATAVPAAPGVSYLATEVSGTDWRVQSLGSMHGQTAAVQEDITEQPAYPFALFGRDSLQLDWSAAPSFSTYSSSSPAATTGQLNPNPAGALTLGSNGTVTCNGSLGTAVTVDYFGSGGVTSTGMAPCGTYVSSPTDYVLPTVTAPASAGTCPGTGVGGSELGSKTPGAPTSLAAGTYLCTAPVSVNGYLDVLGPVQLYIRLDPSLYGAGTALLDVTPGSWINDQSDYCAGGGTTGCTGSQDLPSSANLVVLTGNTGQIGDETGSGFYLGAVLYAPNAYLAADACSSHYYGAVVVAGVTCGGSGPQGSVSYDTALSGVYGPWAAGPYTQIDPSTFGAAMSASGL